MKTDVFWVTRDLLDLLQVDLLASGASLFRRAKRLTERRSRERSSIVPRHPAPYY